MSKSKIQTGRIIAVIFVALALLLYLIYPTLKGKAKVGSQNYGLGSVALAGAQFQSGDIVFQTSLSDQSKAIQAATNSPYSHCGIIFIQQGAPYVFEAVQPVKLTPLKKWIARGKDGSFVVKRLKNADSVLTPQVLAEMEAEGAKHAGKSYDLTFQWGDEEMYCSELIWKIFERSASIELCATERLGDFDLLQPDVAVKLKERFGENIPLDEPVVSPGALFDSPVLVAVAAS